MMSIIIPAHNEEQYIATCLDSIIAQSFPNYEVIVVCDTCKDYTKTIAKRYTKKVFFSEERNVSAARNYGAVHATGNILVFLDADSVVAPNLLKEINGIMRKGIIGGTVKTLSLEKLWRADLLWKIVHFLRFFFFGILPTASGILFCQADTFTTIHGFDVRRKLAEDTHLLLQLRKKGRLAYMAQTWIKTSSRRLEKEGYLWTIFRQFFAFFIRNSSGYDKRD